MGAVGRFLSAIERYSAVISCVVVVTMMFLICVDVVSRKLGAPVTGVFELVELLMVVIVFPGLAYTEKQGEHVKLKILSSRLSEPKKHLLEAIGLLLTIGITALLTVSAVQGVISSLATGDTTAGLVNYPVWPAKLIVVFGCMALWFRFIVQFTDNLRQYFLLRGHAREQA
jgi:TRAP-type C4-dicarboxylate transport system permease small subunit